MKRAEIKGRQAGQILRHGLQLQRIFPKTNDRGPVTLCKQLHRLENKAHRLAEDYCNGVVDMPAWEAADERILDRLLAILGLDKAQNQILKMVFINSDPRGYALKINDEYVHDHNLEIYKDWGGYGIIAPEFDGI